MTAGLFRQMFRIMQIAESVKARQGSCIESSLEAAAKLKQAGIEAELLYMPNHNHCVAGVEDIIIDATLDMNYNTATGKRVFSREEHAGLMQEVAKKEPFCLYMPFEVIYRKVP